MWQVFGEGGTLSRTLSSYRHRSGQVELADAFLNAFETGTHLVGEAPTGSGKSLAALVPAIRFMRDPSRSGTVHTIISTATKGLQGQIVNKDLPFLQRVLPWNFRYALLKGRNNYLCRDAYASLRHNVSRGRVTLRKQEVEELETIQKWLESTVSGDMVELSTNPWVWPLVSRQGDECLGRACGHYETSCFSRQAWNRARNVDVVVCNHYLYLLATDHLPAHDIVIFDEAHELPDIARNVLGWTLSYGSFRALIGFARELEQDKLVAELEELRNRLYSQARDLIKTGNVSKTPGEWFEDSDAALAVVDRVEAVLASRIQKVSEGGVEDIGDNPDRIRKEVERVRKCIERTLVVRNRLEKSLGLEQDLGWIYWKEKDGSSADPRRDRFEARPIAVGPILNRRLFHRGLHSVCFVSATMTVKDSFDYIAEELGLPPTGVVRLIVPSPFDLSNQGVLYIPPGFPQPPGKKSGKEDIDFYNKSLADLCFELVELCGGRSLLLFTSWSRLKVVREALVPRLPPEIRVQVQGEAPLDTLLIRFREDERSIMLGVASLWTGVDVPGNALIGLFIDKIPFPVPDDPIFDARQELVQRSGGNVFMDLSVPMATLALRQGAGRLIRSETDVGVIVIADSRLIEKGYGATIVSSLPRFRRVYELGQGRSIVERVLVEGDNDVDKGEEEGAVPRVSPGDTSR